MYNQAKRPTQSGGNVDPPRKQSRLSPSHSRNTEPSRVVFVGDLLPNTTEGDLLDEMRQYGQILTVSMMPRNHQALVEFENMRDAESVVERFKSGRRAYVRDSPVLLNYSRSAQINEPLKEYKSVAPTSLVLLTVYRQTGEVDADTFRRIGSSFGRVKKISVYRGRSLLALIEFASLEEATRAKPQLNGADIYSNCNTLRCEFVTRRVYELLPLEGCALVEEWPVQESSSSGYSRKATRGSGGSLLAEVSTGGDFRHGRSSINDRGGNGDRFQYSQQQQLRSYESSGYDRGSRRGSEHERPQQYAYGRPQGASSRFSQHYNLQEPRESGFDRDYQQQSRSRGAEGEDSASGCILHVSGLPDSINCMQLFNILCLYGNVRRIKFFASKRGQALVEMMDRQSAVQCVSFLHDESLLGGRLIVELSHQRGIRSVREAVNLPDGTPSIREFDENSRLNRFLTESSARKNPLVKPCRSIYFWSYPSNGTEEELRRLLVEAGAPEPPAGGVEFFSDDHRSGLIRFESTGDALTAICLANHAPIQSNASAAAAAVAGEFDDAYHRVRTVKLCFSLSTGVRRRRPEAADDREPLQKPQQQQEEYQLDGRANSPLDETAVEIGDGEISEYRAEEERN